MAQCNTVQRIFWSTKKRKIFMKHLMMISLKPRYAHPGKVMCVILTGTIVLKKNICCMEQACIWRGGKVNHEVGKVNLTYTCIHIHTIQHTYGHKEVLLFKENNISPTLSKSVPPPGLYPLFN